MANNKVVLSDGTTLIDITDTTATASDVAQGKIFYSANGVQTTGTAPMPKITDASYLFSQNARLSSISELSEIIQTTNFRRMFEYSTNITNLDLTSLDLSLGDCFFNGFVIGCSNLTSIVFPSYEIYVSDIGSGFRQCTALTNLDLSNFNFTNASNMNNVFNGSTALKTIKIGNSNTTYNSSLSTLSIFQNCSSAESITINGTNVMPITNSNAFSGLKSNCRFYVPSNLVNAYKTATNWSARANYIFPIS